MYALLSLLACSTPSTPLRGEVVDLWGRGLPGATVVVEGVVERWQTDPTGAFTLRLETVPARILGAAPGYMRGSVDVAASGTSASAVRIALWPEPPAPGFYGVDPGTSEDGALLHLAARSVSALSGGTKITPTVALPDTTPGAASEPTPGGAPEGEARRTAREPGRAPPRTLAAGTTRFLHKSTLDPRAFRGVDVRLARLREVFSPQTARSAARGRPAGASREERSWTASTTVEVRVEALPGKDCYLLEVPPLTEGVYAFYTGGALDLQDAQAFGALPRERLLAWPFEVGTTGASAR